jgi:hypothetical protein
MPWYDYLAHLLVVGALLRIFFPPLPPLAADSAATMLGVPVAARWLARRFGKVRNSAAHP